MGLVYVYIYVCGGGCVHIYMHKVNFLFIFVNTCGREIVNVCLGCDYLCLLIMGALALLHLVKMNFLENICVQRQDGDRL